MRSCARVFARATGIFMPRKHPTATMSRSDGAAVSQLLVDKILPGSQFFAYLEVGELGSGREESGSELWKLYRHLRAAGAPLSMRRVSNRNEIFSVFHDLFHRRRSREKAP